MSTVYDCYFDYSTNQYIYADGTPVSNLQTEKKQQSNSTPTKNKNNIYSFTNQDPYPYNNHTQIKINMKQLSPILIKMGKCSVNQPIKLKIEKPLLFNIMNKNTFANQQSTLSQLENPSSKMVTSSTSLRKQKNKDKIDKLLPIQQDIFIKQILNTSHNDQMVYMLTNNNINQKTYADNSQSDFSNNGQQQCLQFYQQPPEAEENQSQQLPQNALKLQSNRKRQSSGSKNASRQNFNFNHNIIDEQSKSSSNIVYINVGHPLRFDKINLVNNNNYVNTFPPPQAQIIKKQSPANSPRQRPTTSYVTNTHSVLFQNKERGVSPKNHRVASPIQRPSTYNPSSTPVSSINPVVNLRSIPSINMRTNNSPSNKASEINIANSTRVQLGYPNVPQTPINELKKPNSPLLINPPTINNNKNTNIKIHSPPHNIMINPQNKSPPHIKIIRQNKDIQQNKKVFITYNDKNINSQNSNIKGQPLIHIPRPMSQPSLRPVSAFNSNIKPENSLQIAQVLNKQQNQKVNDVRADYYGNRPVSPPKNIIINKKIVGQLHSPPHPQVLRQCKSSPNLVKINYITPVNYNNNIYSSRNINNNSPNNSPFPNNSISIHQTRPTSPQGLIKIESPRIQNQPTINRQNLINLYPNPVRPASSIPAFSLPDTPVNKGKITQQINNNPPRLENTIINKLEGQQQANIYNQKSDNNLNKNANTGAHYDNRSASKKQRPQSIGVELQPELKNSGKSISVYNYIPPQTEYNLIPRQPQNNSEFFKPGFSFKNQANNQNSIHPIYRQYHDQQQSNNRPGSGRKKLNVISKQLNIQMNAYGLTSGSSIRSPSQKNL